MNAPRVAIYARYSSEAQRDASIEDQVRVCRVRAEREGWEVVKVLADHAISGATTLRPGYQSLLTLLRARGADIVLAESLDRFSRDQEHIAAFFKQVSFAKVAIVTLAEGEITELHIGLKGTMGALYLKDLAAKTRRGLEGRIRQGRSIGTPPYGYRIVRRLNGDGEVERGLREIDPAKAAIVRRIFAQYAAGMGPQKIARALNRDSVPGPGGGIWYDTTIRGRPTRGDGVLRNEAYIGRLVWSRRHSVKDPMSGKCIRRASETADIVIQLVPHLQMIDQPVWDLVQARLAAEAAPAPIPPKASSAFWDSRRPRHLLSGKVICGLCHRPFKAVGQDYLSCFTARQGGCRNTATVRRGPLQERVLDALARQLMHPELVAAFVEAFNEACRAIAAETTTHADTSRSGRAAIERKIANLVDAIADGRANPSLLKRIQDLEAELGRIPTDDAATPSATPQLGPDIAATYRRKIEDMRAALARGTDPEALELACKLIDKIIVSPPKHEGDPPETELVGDLMQMLTTAARPNDPRSSSSVDETVLAVFLSSVKGVPRAEPPPYCLACLPRRHANAVWTRPMRQSCPAAMA